MALRNKILYPFRRLELLAADIFYHNVKLLLMRDDEEIDELYWEWIDAVEDWKQGELHYKVVEAKHEVLAGYVTGEMHGKEPPKIKKGLKQKAGIHG